MAHASLGSAHNLPCKNCACRAGAGNVDKRRGVRAPSALTLALKKPMPCAAGAGDVDGRRRAQVPGALTLALGKPMPCAAGAGDVDGRRGARVPGAGAARVGARGGRLGRHWHRDNAHAWPHHQGALALVSSVFLFLLVLPDKLPACTGLCKTWSLCNMAGPEPRSCRFTLLNALAMSLM